MAENIEWTQELSVNEPKIDEQHQNLVKLTKELITFLDSNPTSTTDLLGNIRKLLHQLETFVGEHFTYEEEYMKKNNYPELEEHAQIHQEFIEFFQKFKIQFNKIFLETGEIGTQLAASLKQICDDSKKFLLSWLIEHMQEEDQKYVKYIDSKK